MKNDKKCIDTNSSAEYVEHHLAELEKADYERLYYSQEQTFNAEALSRLINETRLHELLAKSDAFLIGLNHEIQDFDEDNIK